MARDDNDTYESYEKDIFDNPPRGPIGVHQGNSSFLSRAVPYLVVIAVAAVAGVLVWSILSGEISHVLPGKSETSSQTAKKSDAKDTDKSTKDADKDKKAEEQKSQPAQQQSQPTQPAQPAQPAAPTTNKQTAVAVQNGTSIAGYAAQKQSVLQQAGYTSVTAGNVTGQAPTSTVVLYQNEADKATAQDVANTLGIAAVQQQSGLATPIVVVLLN